MSIELFAAIEKHDLDQVTLLLSRGADPNYLHKELKYYPLHAAIFELDFGGMPEILDRLIRSGADVNRVDERSNGAPPLVAALLDGQKDAARRLLISGADPNLKSRLGDSPLRLCVEHDDLETADMLLKYGANNTINEAGGVLGKNALGHAVSNLNTAMVELLLNAGADPNFVDIDGMSAPQYMPLRTEENASTFDKISTLLERRRPK